MNLSLCRILELEGDTQLAGNRITSILKCLPHHASSQKISVDQNQFIAVDAY